MWYWWQRYRRSELGAVTAEFVLLLPLFAIFTFGIMSAGLGWFRQQQMTTAAREATRVGATWETGDPLTGIVQPSWFNAVYTAADQAALGQWDRICVAYIGRRAKIGETSLDTKRQIHTQDAAGNKSHGPIEAGSTCFDDGRPANEMRAQVEIERGEWFLSWFFTADLTLRGASVTRYETPYPRN